MQAFSLDHLSETEFERFCFDLLIELKFLNVNWRKGTGLASSPSDRGRDIECQLLKDDVDGRQYFERWFVECKHYQQGVPTDRIQTALSWANSERPDTLLIIVSNFLSNATKDYLDNFIANNRPAFRIKYWEKPDIERLTLSKYYLLSKYRISGSFSFLSIMHHAHLSFLKNMPSNTISYLFDVLDRLDHGKRDELLSHAYFKIILPAKHELREIPELVSKMKIDYENFKSRCFEIASMNILGEDILVHYIVSFTFYFILFIFGDLKSISEIYADQISIKHQIINALENSENTYRINDFISYFNKQLKAIPDDVRKSYDLYVYFCENVVEQLLAENIVKNTD